ncbi:sensor histidine kinase [Vallitalea sp.]|jgi:sensor histidine kinase YesM|uniref:sensor histidine kinase n=1 Tax=Vallitalea sp. TaxID=1882829 RepID=UPI0025DE8DB5|nr:histidine kinase [Vallitalea sp.]MCT4687844.1 histidine kinase [Vallitalea sp.]
MRYIPKISLFSSLKSRLIILLITTCTIPIIIIGVISFKTTLNINKKNINIAIESEVSKIMLQFENIMDNMRYVSQQLVLEGFINNNISANFSKFNNYDSIQLLEEIQQKAAFYEVSNPNIANITYYIHEGNKLNKINSSLIKERMSFNNTKLSTYNNITYFGPHRTNSIVSDYLSLSMVRQVLIDDSPDMSIYMESGYRILDNVFDVELSSRGAVFIIVSNTEEIVFCSNEKIKPYNYSNMKNRDTVIINNDKYHILTRKSKFDWSISALIPVREYNKDISSFIYKYIIIFIIAICVSIFIAILIWKMVYIPFIRFSKNLKSITSNNIIHQVEMMNVKELDEDIEVFNNMKEQIIQLAKNIERENKLKVQLEIKQLFYKINPHFLYNTLDTLKWYARTRKEEEIVKFVSALNKLLIYNMEKNKLTTLQSEIIAVENYILIQNMKYDIEFVKNINIKDSLLITTMPRFLLQPLVENAIIHGLEGDGKIIFEVTSDDSNYINIKISDMGYGMDEDKIMAIKQLSENDNISGQGIGMQYVFKMLNNEYGTNYKFYINSIIGEGTDIIITIPINNI